jgi:hypothetical protein
VSELKEKPSQPATPFGVADCWADLAAVVVESKDPPSFDIVGAHAVLPAMTLPVMTFFDGPTLMVKGKLFSYWFVVEGDSVSIASSIRSIEPFGDAEQRPDRAADSEQGDQDAKAVRRGGAKNADDR